MSGRMRLRSFSITSLLHIVFPVMDDGSATDRCSLAKGLRYRLCGKYSGLQSATFFIVCIFITYCPEEDEDYEAVVSGRKRRL